jgi:hypothetical protein
MTLATRPGASASVVIIRSAARPGISIARRGRMSFTTSPMNAAAAMALMT